MTKKGYQKRLPTVVPARPAPPPAPPAPRRAPEAESAPPSPPDVRPVTAPAEARQPSRNAGMGVAFALVILVVGGLVAFVVLRSVQDRPAPRQPAVPDATFAPRMLAAGESYVETRVLENGDIVVRQWIRADEPLERLRLALPDVPGVTGLTVTGIEVLAAGTPADGPPTITTGTTTYTFEQTTDVEVHYRLAGAVEESGSARWRALALATTIDVRYSPRAERETRIVRAPEVLALACTSSPEESPVPCGRADGGNQWRVDLAGSRVLDRIVAQVTLG